MLGFGDAGRDHVVDHAHEGIFKDELLCLATDDQRIQIIAGACHAQSEYTRGDEQNRRKKQPSPHLFTLGQRR